MADEQTSQESSASASETRISCFSKRSQDEANERVFSAINDVIGKNAIWSEEQRDRLRRRFREIYKSTLHENSTVDGQSWAEAADDLDTTKEFEPIDLKTKADAEEIATELDTLIVDTMGKRKVYPPRLTQQVAKKLRCLHTAVEQFKPVLEKAIEDHSPIVSLEDENSITTRASSASTQISTLSRLLPDLGEKSDRLQEAVNIHNSLASNKTYQTVTNPQKAESKMETSLAFLKAKIKADETPMAPLQDAEKVLKRQRLTAQLNDHPIKRYKPSTSNNGEKS
ncbi:kinetochore-associated protein NSL1 homolog [Asterias rubens]|uniref:kinetochore-associated protein NSL1 homolog n=1 Tax=Asterias rubens TaxID=7604 RepID=UPI00145574FD|nr:kinetochore-associated protein NSL1 homolog [Asterias rubens]